MRSTFWGDLGLTDPGRIARICLLLVLEKECDISFPSISQHFRSCPLFSNSCKWKKIIQETVSLTPNDVCHPGDLYVSRFSIYWFTFFFSVYSLLHLLLFFSHPLCLLFFFQMKAKQVQCFNHAKSF